MVTVAAVVLPVPVNTFKKKSWSTVLPPFEALHALSTRRVTCVAHWLARAHTHRSPRLLTTVTVQVTSSSKSCQRTRLTVEGLSWGACASRLARDRYTQLECKSPLQLRCGRAPSLGLQCARPLPVPVVTKFNAIMREGIVLTVHLPTNASKSPRHLVQCKPLGCHCQ